LSSGNPELFLLMPANTLGKKERLKSRKQLDLLFKKGKSFSLPPFRVYTHTAEKAASDPGLQFGVGVSARHFSKAVDRNRIKRLTREAWRLQNAELKEHCRLQPQALHIFFIFTGRELPEFNTIKAAVALAIEKMIKNRERKLS
jgi:ribonuclease P protein component